VQQEEPKANVATQMFSFFSSKFSTVASASLPDVFGNAVEVDVWFESKREYVDALRTQLALLASASNDLVARHARMCLRLAVQLGSSATLEQFPGR
jgi:hypothetical protein